jgi:hypothetical protein
MSEEEKGHFRCYVPHKFSGENLRLIAQANSIIEEYERRGYSLTLRQLYYQHVARGLIENSGGSYSRLGSLINDGRMTGLISWLAIEVRTRALMGFHTFVAPGEALDKARQEYHLDLWATQRMRPEVWVEKEALVDVVGRICNELRIDFFACRGYVSQSEQWRAGRRLASYVRKGQTPIVFHLGDHDPSGIDMTRDNKDRLSLFAGVPIQVVRLALNRDQIEQYGPPPNPAKVTDSRFEVYQREHGDESWELDALDPQVIHNLIENAILRLRDNTAWDAALLQEVNDKELISSIIEDIGGEIEEPNND